MRPPPRATASLAPLLLALVAAPGPAWAAGEVLQRYALVIGASQGGEGRTPLSYAADDARAFSRVVQDMGGVRPEDAFLLVDPDAAAVRGAFEALGARIAAPRETPIRDEVVLYYSGHSDEYGLLLGDERLPYADVKALLAGLGAEFRLAILDSCASGTLLRIKGGIHRPAFLIDESSAVAGQAIITSSSADENAQESDRIGGSFFTHALVTGLRGAADVSRDGRVTLTEAYLFAYDETLARTEGTLGGSQHASYSFELSGSGDVVVTDLRTVEATVLLGPELRGRLAIRDGDGRLVVELVKPPDRTVEIGLGAGDYAFTLETDGRYRRATVALAAEDRLDLSGVAFEELLVAGTALRGPLAPADETLAASLREAWRADPALRLERRKSARTALLGTSGAAAAVAVASLVLAADSHAEFHKRADIPGTTVIDLEPLQTRTNVYSGMWVSAGAIALGTGLGALFVVQIPEKEDRR